MKFSIITVARNAVGTLESCLNSVAEQTGVDLEHLVIDGASCDGTVELLRQRREAHLVWQSEPDRGIYDAMNRGLERAEGDIVGFLNADDFYTHSGVLARVREAFEDPGTEACYGDLDYVSEEDNEHVVRRWRSGSYRPGLFRFGWMPPHPTFFARRDIYRRHGGFDTGYTLGADWDLLMRLMEVEGVRSRYLPEVLIKMRVGGVSNRSLKNIALNNWECFSAFFHNGIWPSPLYPVSKVIHRLAQFGSR